MKRKFPLVILAVIILFASCEKEAASAAGDDVPAHPPERIDSTSINRAGIIGTWTADNYLFVGRPIGRSEYRQVLRIGTEYSITADRISRIQYDSVSTGGPFVIESSASYDIRRDTLFSHYSNVGSPDTSYIYISGNRMSLRHTETNPSGSYEELINLRRK
jgi:hypothetical protein